jgi:hypothetical protein
MFVTRGDERGHVSPDQPNHQDIQRRDKAISRVRRTTRWVTTLAVLGTGAVVGVAAHEVPAKSTAVATSTSSGTGATSTSTGSSGSGTLSPASAEGGALSPPSASPTHSSSTPRASTGAS